MTDGAQAAAHGRLIWRCRRGLKELDVLLERYVRERFPQAPDEERRAFERLLDMPDPELAGFLLGREPAPDPELAELAERIRGHRA